jgi:hypothetical protein
VDLIKGEGLLALVDDFIDILGGLYFLPRASDPYHLLGRPLEAVVHPLRRL